MILACSCPQRLRYWHHVKAPHVLSHPHGIPFGFWQRCTKVQCTPNVKPSLSVTEKLRKCQGRSHIWLSPRGLQYVCLKPSTTSRFHNLGPKFYQSYTDLVCQVKPAGPEALWRLKLLTVKFTMLDKTWVVQKKCQSHLWMKFLKITVSTDVSTAPKWPENILILMNYFCCTLLVISIPHLPSLWIHIHM